MNSIKIKNKKTVSMQPSLKFKIILVASLALFFIACNNDKPKRVKVQEITLQDIKQEDSTPKPPPPPAPKIQSPYAKMINEEKKCYVNRGLKYTTIITIYIGDSEVIGIVNRIDLESGREERTTFTGPRNGDKLSIKFDGTPPVIGAASEWTNKPWTLKKEGAKKILHIIFNAKNYDTNKWENTDYQFVIVDCN
jgi:hypothetical protein